ncbi:MAG TPA: hypothetical protein VGM14_00660 [Streptosporangiaceae bacterium]|jgi:hypothetical protein
MLTTYAMPPRLTAEMYHALGDLPRVTLDRNAVDAAAPVVVAARYLPP